MAKDAGTKRNPGQFKPGQSGNPSGRPSMGTLELRQRLAEAGPKVAKVVIDKALDGDVAAARLVLERIMPALKPAAAPIHLDVPQDATPLQIASGILAGLAGGRISPDAAALVLSAAAGVSKLEETEHLKARIEALERIAKEKITTNRKNSR